MVCNKTKQDVIFSLNLFRQDGKCNFEYKEKMQSAHPAIDSNLGPSGPLGEI